MLSSDVDLCKLIWWAFIGLFRLRVALVAENLALRQQINVLRRTAPKRPRFGSIDRLIFVSPFRGLSTARDALAIVQPATVIRWHRAGFKPIGVGNRELAGGRPTVPLEVRRLIRAMSLANPALGRTADAWRTPQARHRRRADECDEIYGAQEATTVSGLEDVSPQSRGWDCCDGSVRGANNFVSASLWLADPAPRSPPRLMDGRDGTPDCRVDRPPAYGSLRMGPGTNIPACLLPAASLT